MCECHAIVAHADWSAVTVAAVVVSFMLIEKMSYMLVQRPGRRMVSLRYRRRHVSSSSSTLGIMRDATDKKREIRSYIIWSAVDIVSSGVSS